MTRFHMNPATGNPNKCGAAEGNCPFKTEGGDEAAHYASKDEARAGYEKEMEAKLEAERQAKAEEKERNWPTPSQDAVDAAKAKGYVVSGKHKFLGVEGKAPNGTKWDVRVENGQVSVSNRLVNSFGTAFSVRSNWAGAFGDKDEPKHNVEFSDMGTNFSVDDAREHIRAMEANLALAPKLIEKANEATSEAESLFGKPADARDLSYYDRIEELEKPAAPRASKLLDFDVSGEEGFYSLRTKMDIDFRKNPAARPDLYVDMRGNAKVTISLSGGGSMSLPEYQERIAQLKDAVATAKVMEETVAKLPKPEKAF